MNQLLRLLAIGMFLIPYASNSQNNCNADVRLAAQFTSMNSPLGGPYQPGESVTFCLNIDDFQKTNCNWLHGIVPSFGNGWDESSFNNQGRPVNISQTLSPHVNGNWAWYPDNWVTYKSSSASKDLSPGDKVGAGWFFLNFSQPSINPFDPNFTFGDDATCNENNNQWEVCFSLIAKEIIVCEGFSDCSVTMTTFGDGETGGRTGAGCNEDEPITFEAELDCCAAPVMDNIVNQIICDGDQISIPLSASQDPGTTFEWTVSPFQVEGAFSGSGNLIEQNLFAEVPGSPAFVTYTVTPVLNECEGQPVIFTVQLSNLVIDLGQDKAICSGQSVKIGDFPSGGQSPYTYQWSHGPTVFRPTVSPNETTTYSITVTDAFGCSYSDDITVYVGQAGPIEAIGNPCEDLLVTYTIPSFPGSLGYTWSVPSDATIVSGQGTKTIQVDWSGSDGGELCVSLQGGCPSGLVPNCMNIIVGDPITTNGLIGEQNICDDGTMYSYSVNGIQPEYSYEWTIQNGVILSDPTENFVWVDWDTSQGGGVISAEISNGCNTKTETVVTNVAEPSEFVLSGSNVICPTDVVFYTLTDLINPTSGNQYAWSVTPPAQIIAGQGTDQIAVQWSIESGDVEVSVIGTCDVETIVMPVESYDPSGIEIVGNSSACQGAIQTYSLSGSVPSDSEILWVWPSNAVLLSDPTASSIDVSWNDNLGGVISVNLESCTGVFFNDGFEVTVEESDISQLDITLCEGECYTFDGVEYCQEGINILQGTNSSGCPEIVELTLSFLDTPDVVAEAGDDTTVGCTVDRVLDASGSTIPAGAVYQWTDENGNVLSEALTLVVSEPGTYTFEISNPATQCYDEDAVNVSPAAPPVSDAGPNKWINCFNNNMTTIGPAVAGALDYQWIGPNGYSSDIANPIVSAAGIYELIVSDAATGCGSDTASVEVFEGYTLEIEAFQSICDDFDGVVTVSSAGIEQPIFEWNTGDTFSSIQELAPGDYEVTVSSANGSCTEVLSATVTPDLSCKVLIAGNVLDDGEEGDCEEGNGTVPVVDIPVTLSPLGLTVLTDEDGYYEFLVDTGSYVLSVEVPEPYFVLCPGFGTLEVNLPDTSGVSLQNDFFLDYLTNFDLYVTAYAGAARTGSDQNFQVTYCNNFVQTINGKIEFFHAPEVQFDPVANNASSYDPVLRKATWLYAGLSFFECEYLNFSVYIPEDVPIGTELDALIVGRPILGDIAPENNIVEITRTVTSGNAPEFNTEYGIVSSKAIGETSIFPNPTEGVLNIDFANSDEIYKIQIFDVSGKMLFESDGVVGRDNFTIDLNSIDQSVGMRIVKVISSSGELETKRIVKQ